MDAPKRIDRRVRALALSRDCAELGARVRTIHHITGMGTRELLRLLFTEHSLPPRGRAPDTREWYHAANLLSRTEASVIVSNFHRLRALGFGAGEALVSAYRYYRSVYQAPHRISFDRAFDLASHTDGLWVASTPSFSLVTCETCGSEFLDALVGEAAASGACPFCRLVRRAELDPRVRDSFPRPPPIDQRIASLLGLSAHPEAGGESPPNTTPFAGDADNE
jgi:flagellar transcriptional activator FlhC